jgi:uncharacterized protein (TIGR02145 family)
LTSGFLSCNFDQKKLNTFNIMKTKNRTWLSPLVIVIMGLLCLASWCKKEEDNNTPASITDEDGNVYTSVTIGTQVWMVENLKTTKYNDGTAIPNVTDNAGWSSSTTTAAYCWYNDDVATYKASYGALYNWYAASTGKLCPTGWHVPSDTEWATLENYLGGKPVAGGKLKETGTTHWLSPNTGATNETGFTGLPGGVRGDNTPFFSAIGQIGWWWSAAESTVWDLTSGNTELGSSGLPQNAGASVRCLKN